MYLCLDYGDRYIGVAATDTDGTLPHRLDTIDQRSTDPLAAIIALIDQLHCQKILVGVPVSLAGNETEQTKKTMAFITKLKAVLGGKVDIVLVDETLTSHEARRIIELEGAKLTDEHAEAARIMLAEYLARGKRAQ